MSIRLKRIYDKPAKSDGYRVLVDRLWPRGISKADANIDLWLKDVAPSEHLRKWFNHQPEKWNAFKKRYFRELNEHSELIDQLAERFGNQQLTLLFAAKDSNHNNAAALKGYLERRLGVQ